MVSRKYTGNLKEKTEVEMNKPVYQGLSILEISKTLMNEIWYDCIKSMGRCKGLPLLPMQHPEMAHINSQSSVFVSKKPGNKILKLDQK